MDYFKDVTLIEGGDLEIPDGGCKTLPIISYNYSV